MLGNSSEKGCFAYENWKRALTGTALKAVYEYPLFSDARIIGVAQDFTAPYKLLNTVPLLDAQILAPSIILRMEYFSEPDSGVRLKTDIKRFHGGGINDEIAALISLCLGVRLKSGGLIRYFEPDKDPKGQPISWNIHENPILLKTKQRTILPQALREHSLSDAAPLETLKQLSAQGSIELVRAARLYQDAVWIVESEPALSWLMLVSAVEAAANFWRPSQDPPLQRMRLFNPRLEKLLIKAGGEKLALQVAKRIADFMGSTKKFVDFIIEFLPDPPKTRPAECDQHPWQEEDLRKSLTKIYKCRSFALHRGIPFPVPMCEALRDLEEVPSGLSTIARGGVWAKEDAPMLLHTFEYIVRHSLLKWWQSMLV
jgi:hypothetical protein